MGEIYEGITSDLLEKTLFEHYIIFIDYADNLDLGNEYNFENYVRARLNNEKDGFIKN